MHKWSFQAHIRIILDRIQTLRNSSRTLNSARLESITPRTTANRQKEGNPRFQCSAGITFQLMCSTHFFMHIILANTAHVQDRYWLNVLNSAVCYTHVVSLCSAALCMNLIAVEQQLATCWVQKYEQRTNFTGLVMMGLVVSFRTYILYKYLHICIVP